MPENTPDETAPAEMPGKWENGDYSETIGNYRLIIWETSEALSRGYCRWEVQAFDSELGWYKIEGGPKRRYMIVSRAYEQAKEAIRLLVRAEEKGLL